MCAGDISPEVHSKTAVKQMEKNRSYKVEFCHVGVSLMCHTCMLDLTSFCLNPFRFA
jgi:hypothetical protein